MNGLAKMGGVLLLGLLVLPARARADMPPPPDYEESCTREKKEAAGELCESRRAWHGDPYGCGASSGEGGCSYGSTQEGFAVCCPALASQGWTFRCKTYGASAFSVLLCRPRQPGDPLAPVRTGAKWSEDGDETGRSPAVPVLIAGAVVLFLLAAGLGFWRSHRSRPDGR